MQKTVEAAGDLIDNKTAGKITKACKKSKKLHNNEANDESETTNKRYIPPEKSEQFIDELRLI